MRAVRAGMIVIAGALAGACGLAQVGTGPSDVDASAGTADDSGAVVPDSSGMPPVDSGSRFDARFDAPPDTETPGDAEPDVAQDSPSDGPVPPSDTGLPADVVTANDTGTADAPDASDAADAPDASDAADAPDASDTADAMDASDTADASDASDAAEAGPTVLAFVQGGHASQGNSTSVSVPLSPTKSGTFLVVMSSYYAVSVSMMGVADNASSGTNTYVSADLRSVQGTCQASEIWYARDAHPGATSVTITMSGSAMSVESWVVEVSGLSETGGADKGMIGSGGATNTITAPTVTPSGAPALVIAAIGSCGTIGGLAGGNPFTALTKQDGNNVAYYIPTTNGTWGPVFSNSNAAWNASVAAFR